MSQEQDTQDTQDTQNKQVSQAIQNRQVQKKYPNPPHISWPTSRPGPEATLPPPGQKPMPSRTEQCVEIGYNQETGTPITDSPARSLPDAAQGPASFDQPTAQQTVKKRKERRIAR